MASYGSSIINDHVRSTIAEVKSLTVERLKKVLRTENLQVSGIKSELQVRLIAHIESCARQNDFARVERIRSAVRGITVTPAAYPPGNAYPSPFSNHTPNPSLSPQYNSPTPRVPPPMPPYPLPPWPTHKVFFKISPFYNIIRPLTAVRELKVREQTRDTARVEFNLDATTIQQLQSDRNIRVMVFCSAETLTAKPHDPVDISFPQHGELKVNQSDFRHSLKGLKNKPGTTPPPDITDFLRKQSTYRQILELMYALTSKKYFLVVNLVQKRPVEHLVAELQARSTPFEKHLVIKEMQSKASDPDIEATSWVMSLKDPLQMTRINIPCRGSACLHNACFDAAPYIALQEQAEQWKCPHCNKPAPWSSLRIDRYFEDILRRTPSSIDQVTIEPDGQWRQGEPESDAISRDSDDEDIKNTLKVEDSDVIEIIDARPTNSRDAFRTPSVAAKPGPFSPVVLTPNVSTPASGPGPQSRTSSKRPHTETIDLTLSDDDEPPSQRVKGPSLQPPARAIPPHPPPPYLHHSPFGFPKPSSDTYNNANQSVPREF